MATISDIRQSKTQSELSEYATAFINQMQDGDVLKLTDVFFKEENLILFKNIIIRMIKEKTFQDGFNISFSLDGNAIKKIVPIPEKVIYKVSSIIKFTLQDWTVRMKKIEDFFSYYKYDKQTPIAFSPGVVIIDPEKFIESHRDTVKNNYQIKTFLPYLERLEDIVNYFSQQESFT